jgi:hypothetical protein
MLNGLEKILERKIPERERRWQVKGNRLIMAQVVILTLRAGQVICTRYLRNIYFALCGKIFL